jgi:hypothetical protein
LRMCVPEPCSRAFLLRIDIVRRVSMRRADWKALIAPARRRRARLREPAQSANLRHIQTK